MHSATGVLQSYGIHKPLHGPDSARASSTASLESAGTVKAEGRSVFDFLYWNIVSLACILDFGGNADWVVFAFVLLFD